MVAIDSFSMKFELDLFSVLRFELDLISVSRPELTWILCGGRKTRGFSVWIEINLVFVWGHRNRLDFRVGIELT